MRGERALKVPFRRLVPGARPPERAHAGDAGYDLRVVEGVELPPGGRSLVRTGLSVAIPEGYAGLVLPRSGLASRHGVSLANAPGLIDPGYRGEVRIPLINHDPRESFRVEPGMRVAQLLLVRAEAAAFVEAASLGDSPDGRGEAGFGSSGT
ncbi:deoxyuridine 5'-triphosphate nucleotidohydrolase [Rubrobacter xylanophilus]|uniref:Deoxyuridine 5'-triphosphate nucleotidohydrolase n=1 Tax=Rubrobacter xylanophilus TaxID=49319 RepID=A0A510HIY0_9ACTN|nr:dUTP diphosphatase [Rubrobacter xylanophilus]BBL79940.1 deoxyuridine 5'-triphosphate nucleotidohydrolase [Rubrobacter xylanophilus]